MTAQVEFDAEISRRINGRALRNPHIVSENNYLYGITPCEYRDAITAYIQARMIDYKDRTGRAADAPDDVGWTPTWLDSCHSARCALPPELRARCIAAWDRHCARTAARQNNSPAPLAVRLAAYRAGYRYGISYPNTQRVWGESSSLTAVRLRIESAAAPGYTSEPFFQLVSQSPLARALGRGWRVIAEYSRGEWLSPLAAAGFVSRRVR